MSRGGSKPVVYKRAIQGAGGIAEFQEWLATPPVTQFPPSAERPEDHGSTTKEITLTNERPSCECHGEPMYRNGVRSNWRCAVKARERNARRIRMRAGYDMQFFLGNARTGDAAEHLRRRIREEAPRYA